MLIDEVMPEWGFDERHSIVVNARPDAVYDALEAFTARESPIFVVLMGIRGLPSLVAKREAFALNRPILDNMERFGFVRLGERRPEELAIGFAGKPWLIAPSLQSLNGPDEFRTFARDGYVKAVTDFTLSPENGMTRLSTETRVQALGPRARAFFGAYWLGIRAPSGVIRRSWLKAIKKRAETAGRPAR
jgi:hypothetical protein